MTSICGRRIAASPPCYAGRSGTVAGSAKPPTKPGIKLALMAGAEGLQKAGLQMGVTHVIAGAGLGRQPRDQYVEHLQRLKARYAAAGMQASNVRRESGDTN